jgi:hypothetical protein
MSDRQSVILESARIGWPGRMSDMLKKGAKEEAEAAFLREIDLSTVSSIPSQKRYDVWHSESIESIGTHRL